MKTQRLTSLLGLLLGSTPGFVLPFAVASSLGDSGGALLLLSVSISTVVQSVFASAIEVSLIPVYGIELASGGRISSRVLRRAGLSGVRSQVLFIVPASLALALFYTAVSEEFSFLSLLMECWPVLLVPFVVVLASPYSAFLIARGRIGSANGASFFRCALAIVVVLVVGDSMYTGLALLGGEIFRALILSLLAGPFLVSDADAGDSALDQIGRASCRERVF